MLGTILFIPLDGSVRDMARWAKQALVARRASSKCTRLFGGLEETEFES